MTRRPFVGFVGLFVGSEQPRIDRVSRLNKQKVNNPLLVAFLGTNDMATKGDRLPFSARARTNTKPTKPTKAPGDHRRGAAKG